MKYSISLIILFLLLSGCGHTPTVMISTATMTPQIPVPSETPSATANPPTASPPPPTETPTPQPTATLVPPPVSICASRPTALSPFTPPQTIFDIQVFLSVLPIEKTQYQWEPRLITHIPTYENGHVITRNVSVSYGHLYADPLGSIQTYYGRNPLILPQLVVTYTLKTDLKWSDGQSLTTSDIEFSYTLAKDPLAYGFWKDLAALTAELVLIDDYQITWIGLPGYVNNNYPGFLFPPQPEHKWSGSSLSEILLDRYPLSNGPYRILDWENEDTIHLVTNPYFDGKSPDIDRLVIKFPDVDPVFWDEMYLSGYCDLLLPGDMVNYNWMSWTKLVDQDHAVMWHSASATILRLDFNVASSSRLLREIKTRLGLANCISRGHLSELTPDSLTTSATSFIPENHPAYNPASVWRVPYDIEVGQGILEEVGWVDEDNDGIRESHNVPGIRDNTPLTLTLTTSSHDISAAEVLREDFKACGVGIEIESMGPHQLFAASTVSPLYSGNFELALYQWDAHIPEGCSAWLSYRIPENTDAGGEYNYSRFDNSLFDEACHQAVEALDQTQQALALSTAQAILSEELPTLFLVWEPLWLIGRPGLGNIVPDATTFGRLYQPQGIIRERQ